MARVTLLDMCYWPYYNKLTLSVYYDVSLYQVQNDLTRLRKRLGRIDQDGTLDVQALDAAIRRTEDGIKVTDPFPSEPHLSKRGNHNTPLPHVYS